MNVIDFYNCLKDKGFILLAGKSGTSTEITTINMMENPDTIKWIKPSEFILTTGYFLKDDEELQLDFIRQLSTINAAGIGIKKNRYIGELSQKIIDEANKLKVPIILIPYEYSLSDVSSIFFKELYERQSKVLRKSIIIHDQFMNIVLSGGSIDELSKELVNLIKNPLLIINEYGEILSNIDFNIDELLEHELFTNYNGDYIADVSILKKSNVNTPHKAIKYIINVNDKEVILKIKPIVSEREIFGYIIVNESIRKMSTIDYIAIEKASLVIVLDRMKHRAIEETKQIMRRDFFDDLLEGKIQSESELENIAMIYGLKSKYNYSCMIVQFNNINHSVFQYYSEKKPIGQFREDTLKLVEMLGIREQIKVVSIIRGAYLIVFIPFKQNENHKENKENALSFAKHLEEAFMTQSNKYSLSIGIGKSYPIASQYKSFKEAMDTIRLASEFKEKGIAHYDDYTVYHILNSSNNSELLTDFYNNTIKMLVDYDLKNNTNLVNTLECYFKCGGNMSEAAKLLYIHRNTLLYRLDKIKEILNTDLDDWNENLEIHLGIHMMKLFSIYK